VSFRCNPVNEPRGYSYFQADAGTLKIRHNNLIGWEVISPTVPAPEEDKWYTVECLVKGPRVDCFLDGQLVVSTDRCPVNAGMVGFRTLNTKIEIDYLLVENLEAGALVSESPATDSNETVFRPSDYFPLQVGNKWTYRLPDGSALVRTVTGTDLVCGKTCLRVESSNTETGWWAADSEGAWLVRGRGPEGFSTTFCPEEPTVDSEIGLGYSKTSLFNHAPIRDIAENQVGTAHGSFDVAFSDLETITTPLGTFTDCLHGTLVVTTYVDGNESTPHVNRSETWFARDIGPVKQIDFSGNVLVLAGAALNGASRSPVVAAEGNLLVLQSKSSL